MKSFKNILLSILFIMGYAFSTQAVAEQSPSSMSDETLSAQQSIQQTECGMGWSWD